MKILEECQDEDLLAEAKKRGMPDYRVFAADADAARAERDAMKVELDAMRLATGLLTVIKPCEPKDHQWSPCTRSPVTVCVRCGDRIDGSVAFP